MSDVKKWHSTEEIDQLAKERGWLTVTEQLKPGMLDAFMAHSGVFNIRQLEELIRGQRETYLKVKMRFDLELVEMDDEWYNDVLVRLSVLHEYHANIRKIIAHQESKGVENEHY